ncbi:MAG: hypothetical protein LLF94_04900 [Chlamydiales bacterium]|nr:hypothetical protein [Chlamydiales bacterium]
MHVFFTAPSTHIVLLDPAMAQKKIDKTLRIFSQIKEELSKCIPANYSTLLQAKVVVIQSETVGELSTHLAIIRVENLVSRLVDVSTKFLVRTQGLEQQFAHQIAAIRLQSIILSYYATRILNLNKILLDKQLAAFQRTH